MSAAMMSGDEIYQKIVDFLTKVEAKIEQISNRINSVLSHVPGFLQWAVDKVIEAWNKLLAKLEEFWAWFTDKLSYVGDPLGLWNTGEDWNTVVGIPGREEANKIDEEHELLVDDTWTGLAANEYTGQVPAQESTMRLLGQRFASTVSTQLKVLAGGIVGFWILVIAGLVTFIYLLAGASAATVTVIGIPPAVLAVIVGIVAFLGGVGGGTVALAISCKISGDSLRDLVAYSDDWPEFAA